MENTIDQIENNKLIAEFMGAKYIRNENLSYEPKGSWRDLPKGCVPCGWVQDYHLKFGSDWNWLMEVVEKIYPLVWSFDIGKKGTILFRFKEGNELPSMYSKADDKTPIEACYDVVVQFIKWHNSNPK